MAKKKGKKRVIQKSKTVTDDRLASSGEPAVRKKTIVGGFNPEVDFGDILNQWERTGEVELDLSTKKSRSSSQVKRSFGEILAEWEGEGKPKKEDVSKTIQKSTPYKPTQDFGELLDAFEGKQPKKRPPTAAVSSEHPPKRRTKKQVSSEPEIPLRPSKEMQEALNEKAELDAERGESEAAWSFADTFVPANKRRPKGKRRVTVHAEKSEPPTEEVAKRSEPYVPTEEFGALLAAFEEKQQQATVVRESKKPTPPVVPKDTKLQASSEITEALSEKAELDEERGESVAVWSFADTYRSWSAQSDEEGAIQRSQKEKRERTSSVDSIAELRALLPEETIDLHGLTVAEAEEAVSSFLAKSYEGGVRKVAIITGKGLHNELGYSLVKEAALEQIRLSGLVREAYSPKARHGGSGAIWVILKRKSNT